MRLRALQLDLDHPGNGSLRQAIVAALASHGRPLRWAITRVAGGTLAVEAVVLEAGVPSPSSLSSPLPSRSSGGGL